MTTDHPSGEHPHRDWPYRRPMALRYGVALLAVMAAFSIRYVVYGDFMNRLVFTFFVPAALVAAWYGGLGPGILATVVSLLLGDYFFLPPRHAFWPIGNRELMALVVYGATTSLCVILCESLHNQIRRLEHALDRARHHHHLSSLPEAPVSPPDRATIH